MSNFLSLDMLIIIGSKLWKSSFWYRKDGCEKLIRESTDLKTVLTFNNLVDSGSNKWANLFILKIKII